MGRAARPRVALVTARAARGRDEDEPLLLAALSACGLDAAVADWDDPDVPWAEHDAVVLRSPWDYAERHAEFLAWAGRASASTVLWNPLVTVAWNTDKHYLRDLAEAGVATVPTLFVEPGDAPPALPWGAVVVKPAVSAGARDTARHTDAARARAHVQRLLDAGRAVLVQPYLERVDDLGESSLVLIEGVLSHAVRKGPLLAADAGPAAGLHAEEVVTQRAPTGAERSVAERALAVAVAQGGTPLYARVDLLPGEDGAPVLLELELTEPSLFLAHSAGAADRFAAALASRLR